MTVIRGGTGEVLALVDQSHIWFAAAIEVLETDHPRLILHRDRESDPELAERFNVPLEQIEAKHLDLAMRQSETAA